tara:strand:- start:1804 stop:2157 length:354 start_codon:yes stop_codon:yes gene_type:complete
MATSKIAPHKGTEVFGVLMGTKPLGSVPLDSTDGRAVLDAQRLYTHVKNGVVYFALTEGPLNAFKFLTSESAKLIIRTKADHNRAMGRLFGYTEEEIEAFIATEVACDCIACTGAIH